MAAKRLHFLKSTVMLLLVMLISTTEGFSKKHHIGNPTKTLKKGVKKAGKAVGGSLKIVDKALVKAGLPNSKDIKQTLKCVVPTLKDLDALRKNPKNAVLLKKLRQGKCRKELQILDNDCHGPAVFVASMIPNVGGAISYVCGQVGSVNSRVESALDKAEQAQAMMRSKKSKEIGASDDEPEDDSES
jgi:hypothetical protein